MNNTQQDRPMSTPPDFAEAIKQAEMKQFAYLKTKLEEMRERWRQQLSLTKEQFLTERDFKATGLTATGIIQRTCWHLNDYDINVKLNQLSKIRQVKPLLVLLEWLNNPSSGASVLVNSALSKNLAEELAFGWFKEQVEHLGGKAEILPKRGKRSLYLTMEGRVIGSGERGLHHSHSRSIDFKGNLNGKTIYVSAKYTQGNGGGSQDNQGKEMEHFLTLASRNQDPWAHFMVVADGAYFQQVKKGKNQNWMDQQRDNWRDYPRLVITSSTPELIVYLQQTKNAPLEAENTHPHGKDSLDWQGAQADKFDQHSKHFSW